ncbi:MAG: IS5 family transposase [Candidatus Eisenbacteria bacterium]|nr:IS5 family transposase [Candidatus Eisenbacteria bacterium]
MDLTDEQWTLVEPLIPKPKVRADGRGRPWCDVRQVLNGILWILRTGARWRDVPDRYPSLATCHRRHQERSRTGVFNRILTALAEDLRSRGKLDLTECFVDATLGGGEKRELCVGPTKRGKGSKIMAVADRSGLPVAIDVASASPAEVTLVKSILDAGFLPDAPHWLIGDKAYDSDALAEDLAEEGIELIAPNRSNRKVKTQDGHPLRRYKRRWKVERLFAWLQNFRRILTRHDRNVLNYLGFVLLG